MWDRCAGVLRAGRGQWLAGCASGVGSFVAGHAGPWVRVSVKSEPLTPQKIKYSGPVLSNKPITPPVHSARQVVEAGGASVKRTFRYAGLRTGRGCARRAYLPQEFDGKYGVTVYYHQPR